MMKRSADPASRWIYHLTAGCLFGATVLRSLIKYQHSPKLGHVLGLLLVFLVLFASETAISGKWPVRWWTGYFSIYLVFQTLSVVALLLMPLSPDYFAVLFAILSMQAMQRFTPRAGALWIGLYAPLTALPLVRVYGAPQAIAFALIYTAVNVFLTSYTLATRRAQAARVRNQALTQELQETNRQLQAYSKQLEQLAVARERHRLARDLHDSVTQTIFSMTLTTQSALLLLERDPTRLGDQLGRLTQLAQSALAEMRVLISELRPEKVAEGGLVAALRRHLADRRLPENLSVCLDVDGDGALRPAEEQGLFRIAQEALNNIAKHARASQGYIRLHLAEPFWVEIEDRGQGFDLGRAPDSSRVGLASMRERAAEIGWNLQIISSPGAGTRIRIERPSSEEERV